MIATTAKRHYRRYLRNPEITVPKTTAWRHGKHVNTTDSCSPHSHRPAKRKRYNVDSSLPVPRQTRSYWNKIDHQNIVSVTISDSEQSAEVVGNLDDLISVPHYDCCEANSNKNDDIEVKDLTDSSEVDECQELKNDDDDGVEIYQPFNEEGMYYIMCTLNVHHSNIRYLRD